MSRRRGSRGGRYRNRSIWKVEVDGPRWGTARGIDDNGMIVHIYCTADYIPSWVSRGAADRFKDGTFNKRTTYELDDTEPGGLGFFRFVCVEW